MRVGLLVLVAVLAALALLVMTRPAVIATSSVDPDVAVECSAATGADAGACLAWGDAILAEGSPTTTFEAADLSRLRLDRALFGFGAECRAEWVLGRYPDDVAWTEEIACGPS